jgi:hypothetical protein
MPPPRTLPEMIPIPRGASPLPTAHASTAPRTPSNRDVERINNAPAPSTKPESTPTPRVSSPPPEKTHPPSAPTEPPAKQQLQRFVDGLLDQIDDLKQVRRHHSTHDHADEWPSLTYMCQSLPLQKIYELELERDDALDEADADKAELNKVRTDFKLCDEINDRQRECQERRSSMLLEDLHMLKAENGQLTADKNSIAAELQALKETDLAVELERLTTRNNALATQLQGAEAEVKRLKSELFTAKSFNFLDRQAARDLVVRIG